MKKVLVIDDELDLLELTTEALQFEDFEVIAASSGIEGLRLAREDLPDIVVCDINMSDMDGFEVLENLRNDLQTSEIPFIFLSALSQREDVREGMKRGADDYLIKPVNIMELSQTIHSRLERQTQIKLSRLHDFAQRLVVTQENERHNFAINLKDNLGDKLADLKISLDTLHKFVDAKYTLPLKTASIMLDDLLKTINKLSYTLWPSVLSHLGLEAAVVSLLDQIQEDSDFIISFEHHDLDSLIEPRITIMIYRIIQEALKNVVLHAQVNKASLKLWYEEENLRLQIEDNGVGFDVQKALNAPNKVGLLGMVERAYLLNGELNIISIGNEGTRIYGKFPIKIGDVQPKPISNTKNVSIGDFQLRQQKGLIRLAIADSSELNRWGYTAIIATDSRFEVVAELENWVSLFSFLEDIHIDFLVISHNLEGTDSALLNLKQIKEKYPQLKILFLANYTDYSFATQVLKNGATAYLLKTSSSEEIIRALDALLQEEQYIAKNILESKRHGIKHKDASSMDAFSMLTDREREVFYHVIAGKTNYDIASELVISTRTVETHRLNMMRKLGITGTAALIQYALNKGLLS